MEHINLIYNDISVDELENKLTTATIIPSNTKGVTIADVKVGLNKIIDVLNQFKDISVLVLIKYHPPGVIGSLSKARYITKLHLIQDYVEKPNLKIPPFITELHIICSRKISGTQVTDFFDYAGAREVVHLFISKPNFIEYWFELDLPDNIRRVTLVGPELTTELNAWFANNGFLIGHRTLIDITYIKQ